MYVQWMCGMKKTKKVLVCEVLGGNNQYNSELHNLGVYLGLSLLV